MKALATSPNDAGRASPALVPLIFWICLQLLALGVALLRIPFWAEHPEPGDSIAVDIVLIIQVVTVALLFPKLCATWRTTAATILIALPFIEMAGLLSDIPRERLLVGGLSFAAWCGILWLCVPLARVSRRTLMLSVALASLATLGGPLLLYFHYEFSSSAAFDWGLASKFGPLMNILAVVHLTNAGPLHFIPLTACLAIGGLLRVGWLVRSRVTR